MDGDRAPPHLQDYVVLVRARAWMVLLVTAAAIAVAAFFSYTAPQSYAARTRVVVRALPAPTAPHPLNMSTESELAASTSVAALAADDLDLGLSPEQVLSGLGVQEVEGSEVLVISYSAEDPELARDAADAFARNYLRFRVDDVRDEFEAAAANVRRRILNTRTELVSVAQQVGEGRGTFPPGRLAVLEAERRVLEARLAQLRTRLDQVTPGRSLDRAAGEIIEPAQLPTSPSSPNHARDLGSALIVGLLLGVVAILAADRLRDRFGGRGDLESALEAPVLGTVPSYDQGERSEVVILSDPRSVESEIYRAIAARLARVAEQAGARTVLITSAVAGEGKTITAANIALALGELGKSVALVSADLRRPKLDRYLGVETDVGLSTWLMEDGDDSGVPWFTLDRAGAPDVDLLPAGPLVDTPVELLSSLKAKALFETIRESYDLAIFDVPPVLPVVDASIVGALVDGAVLVVDASTPRRPTLGARRELDNAGIPILGSVHNGVDPAISIYPRAYYSYLAEVDTTPASDRRRGRSLLGRAVR